MTALVCDIGGTNTRLGLVEDGAIANRTLATYPNDGFGRFEDLLSAHLDHTGTHRLTACCVALAGIATRDGAELTNRDWTIRRSAIETIAHAADIGFLNDFEALGFALLGIEKLDTRPIFAGRGRRPERA